MGCSSKLPYSQMVKQINHGTDIISCYHYVSAYAPALVTSLSTGDGYLDLFMMKSIFIMIIFIMKFEYILVAGIPFR